MLNPWELACLSREKKISSRIFRDLYCDYGGIRLRFNGKAAWNNKNACSQYIENIGCSIHAGRPLACRLFPIGRRLQNETVRYFYEGDKFPCLKDCPEVSKLPQMSVGEYLKDQLTDKFEKAQDEYLIILQNMADIAFMLLLDTDLAKSGDKKTLKLWRETGSEPLEVLAKEIGDDWLDSLMIPEISYEVDDPVSFARIHNNILLQKAQEKIEILQTKEELQLASVLMIRVSLFIASSLGANTQNLSEHWIEIAKNNGAKE